MDQKDMNGTITNYTYNGLGRITTANGSPYTYDNNGNLVTKGTETFTYDWTFCVYTVHGQRVLKGD